MSSGSTEPRIANDREMRYQLETANASIKQARAAIAAARRTAPEAVLLGGLETIDSSLRAAARRLDALGKWVRTL